MILLCVGFSFYSHGQNQSVLDIGNTAATISDNGILFNKQNHSSAGYAFPKDSNSHVIYSSGIWVQGIDQDSSIHGTASFWDGDLMPGPVADDYNSSYYTSNYDSCIWHVTKAEIDNHISNWINVGYTPTSNIANWPANGNSAEGISNELAPYVDHNMDGVYNPLDGDYPDIRGDEAVYVIMNDDHYPTNPQIGCLRMGIEIHLMLYQYASGPQELVNSTFMNKKIYNRRDTAYTNVRLGIWVDFDIGGAFNDYIGTDSTGNMIYGYNGTTYDSGSSGQTAYGYYPPACGIKFLNETIGSSMAPGSGGGVGGSPNNCTDTYRYLNGMWTNGAPLTYGGSGLGGSSPTNVTYSGDPESGTGWSEVSLMNPPGDRRMLMGSTSHNLDPGSDLCFDLAIITNNDDSTAFTNVTNLKNDAVSIQAYYDQNIAHCWYANPTVSLPVSPEEIDFKIFPNPSEGQFVLSSPVEGEMDLFDISGKLIHHEVLVEGLHHYNLPLNPGVYLIQLSTETQSSIKKLVVE